MKGSGPCPSPGMHLLVIREDNFLLFFTVGESGSPRTSAAGREDLHAEVWVGQAPCPPPPPPSDPRSSRRDPIPSCMRACPALGEHPRTWTGAASPLPSLLWLNSLAISDTHTHTYIYICSSDIILLKSLMGRLIFSYKEKGLVSFCLSSPLVDGITGSLNASFYVGFHDRSSRQSFLSCADILASLTGLLCSKFVRGDAPGPQKVSPLRLRTRCVTGFLSRTESKRHWQYWLGFTRS